MNTPDENVVLSSIVRGLGKDAKLYRVTVLGEVCTIERNEMPGLLCELRVLVDDGEVYIRIDGEWRDVSFDSICDGMGQNTSEE